MLNETKSNRFGGYKPYSLIIEHVEHKSAQTILEHYSQQERENPQKTSRTTLSQHNIVKEGINSLTSSRKKWVPIRDAQKIIEFWVSNYLNICNSNHRVKDLVI